MEFIEEARQAFQTVRTDFLSLKKGMNDWIVYLNSSNRQLKNDVKALEQRIRALETREQIRERRDNSDNSEA